MTDQLNKCVIDAVSNSRSPGCERDDAVAIVGYAFRFPGDLCDGDAFWEALTEARDLVGRIPEDRWAVDELEHPKRGEPGRSITFSAGVLSRIDEFDAHFFGISPREASWLDPQQRLLLELSWEAMENGGVLPSSLAGSDCAVYVGISGLDYGIRGLDDFASFSPHLMTGNTLSIAANRLSYVFDLRGPSLAVDTACSSSLVALHHACNSLRSGEASIAIAGGVNLLLNPYPFIGFTKASMLSASGRCRAFDAEGDGYVRSEGGAVLLLKPLRAALADGDDIEGVILASGANADGARKTGITIPSAEGQAELMRKVLARSGLQASDVDFVEAHGTGTAIGDPIETTAIGEVYGVGRDRPLPIGSVKANLGHLEPASGMAGLVKTLLALKHHALPPSLHLNTPNPRIDFSGLNLELARTYHPLQVDGGKPLVAGVNSFGFGGANAHVLLQEAPPVSLGDRQAQSPDTPSPLFLSARSDAALRALAGTYSTLLQSASEADFYDMAYAAAFRRDRLELRLAVQQETVAAAARQLACFAVGEPSAAVVEEALPQPGAVAFVYSGNGSQWLGMGRVLLQRNERFAELVGEIDRAVLAQAGFSIVEQLLADADVSRLDDTVVAQPLLFAVQVALTVLLRERGCAPNAVVGHSVGEVTAAWAAGALDLQQAIRVICARSEAQGATRGHGRMAAVGLSEQAMLALLVRLGVAREIEIAGINSPNNVTIAGSLDALSAVERELQPQGVFYYLLDLDYAFHSRHMEAIQERLLDSLEGLAPTSAATATYVSTVTGEVLDGTELGADYWWRNVREPVRFAAAIDRLLALGCRVFVEIGPHAILQRYIAECAGVADLTVRVLPSLRRDDDAPERVQELALRLMAVTDAGEWKALFPGPGKPVRLPNYPWQKERHWHPRTVESVRTIERRRIHPLLGWGVPGADLTWENTLDTEVLPWLADHRVGGAVVFPGAGYAEMALAAANEWLGGEHLAVEELDIVSPLVFDGEHARTLRLAIDQRDGSFRISSRQRLSEDAWTLHAAGRIVETTDRLPAAHIVEPSEGIEVVEAAEHYALAADLALDYGPQFQRLSAVRVGESCLCGAIIEQGASDDPAFLLHPAVLDVCFQSLVDFFRGPIRDGRGVALLPVKLGRLEVIGQGPVVRFRGQLRRASARSVLADFELLDDTGRLLAAATGCRFRAAPLASQAQQTVSQWRMLATLQPHPADGLTAQLPGQHALLERLHALAAPDGSGHRARWFTEALPLFEALTLSFVYEAFQAAEQRRPGCLPGLVDSDRGYVRWLAGLLQQEGLLLKDAGGVHLVKEAGIPAASEIWQALLGDLPDCLPQLTLLGRVGRQLSALLLDEIEPEAFETALRQSPAAEALYEDDPAYSGIRQAIESLLGDLATDWPAHRRLRVLEIVAGGSELPRGVTALLPADRLDYVLAVADESAYRRQKAEYQDRPNLQVVELDTDEWQLKGGLLPGRFDVVIVRHALHCADRPHALLTRTHRWLAGGGLLLVAERYPDWSANLISGIGPHWWHGLEDVLAGETGMPVSSLHSPGAWQQAMLEAGFEDIELFTEPASEGLAEGAYLLMARTPDDEGGILSAPEAASWTLIAGMAAQPLAEHLRVQLESQGQEAVMSDSAPTAGSDNVVLMLGWGHSAEASSEVLSRALSLVQRLAASRPAAHLWFVTRGGALVAGLPEEQRSEPVQAALWGFARVVMNEHPELNCTLIDLPPAGGGGAVDDSDLLQRLLNELLWPDGIDEIVLGRQARYGLSLQAVDAGRTQQVVPPTRFRLDFKVPGQLRNLQWLPHPVGEPGEHGIEVRTVATGLNFRDVMYLMGLLPDEAVENGFAGASLGLEFAGVVERVGSQVREFQPGDRVMGFGASCFASHVITRSDALAPMPEDWDFAAAASVPTVFFTVYYALKHLADLQPGERVLIHGAAGGVGIAAIQLARYLGAEIFATAGSEEKRDFVRLLGADHVLDSRSLAYADDILTITDGEGVDVVLNSLAGEAIRRNLRVLKPFGRFLELGKRDFFENTPIGLRPFKDNISYFGIDADQLLTARPQLAGRLFRQVMALFREGVLTPLPYRTFSATRVVEAFRFMQQARHIGKVVVSFEDAQPVVTQDRPRDDKRFVADGDSTWLVTGGLGGFGLESARWLVSRGVKHLVLLGRRGLETPGAAEAVARLAAEGVQVAAESCDITDAKALGALIKRVSRDMPPLRGVLHAAMVIDDRLIGNLDANSMASVLRPKLVGAWNLHEQTLAIPLDHFVLYSSITTSIGNPGQGNYVAANAGLEGLAELRRQMGLPALCVGWGPIGDTGYLTRNAGVKDSLEQRLGRAPLSADQALNRLDSLLLDGAGVVSLANFEWGALSRLLPSAESTRFGWLNRTLADKGQSEDQVDFKTLIAGKTEREVEQLVRDLVIGEIAATLCTSAERIDANRSLHDLGMDSLMAVELAVGLERRFGIQLPAMMLTDAPTATRVVARIVEKLIGSEEDMADDTSDLVQGVLQQHGETTMSRDELDTLSADTKALANQGTRLI